ncbi:hypothetical protein [Yoonia sp. BS5-3]|uniref:DUF2268 domain-containing protein n=1 Tax=Yoonia phaeophyticola TaxID=3137369 RepID=A0ABZ2V0X3_9RHOB
MFWRQRASIGDDLKDWIEDSFDWCRDRFGVDWQTSRQLITADKTFFTAGAGHTPEVAQQIADDIAKLIPVRSIEVQPIAALDPEYRHSYQDISSVAGAYLHDDEVPLINYDPSLMTKPIAFINTMTHELMHDRLASYVDDMPGGEPAHELSTDLHCTTHGFGLFALDGPAQVGWSGYMTQESRAYALATFLDRHDVDPEFAASRISGRSAKALRRAVAERMRDFAT